MGHHRVYDVVRLLRSSRTAAFLRKLALELVLQQQVLVRVLRLLVPRLLVFQPTLVWPELELRLLAFRRTLVPELAPRLLAFQPTLAWPGLARPELARLQQVQVLVFRPKRVQPVLVRLQRVRRLLVFQPTPVSPLP